MHIMQGDAYDFGVVITLNGGPIDIDLVEKAEMVVGTHRKEYPGELTYDSNSGKFLFPLTQEESFSLCSLPQPAQIRIKFKTGEVFGGGLGTVNVSPSASKEVL